MGADGVFQASQILLKCPSKYEAKATEQAPSK
jgi:cytochrome c-type biogenesis protein CcmE